MDFSPEIIAQAKQLRMQQSSTQGIAPDASIPRLLVDRIYNGSVMGLGDEIQAVGGAAAASPVILAQALMRGDSFGDAASQANPIDLYHQGVDIGRQNARA